MILMMIVGIYAIAAAKIRFTPTRQLTGQRARAYGLTLLLLAVPVTLSFNALVRALPSAMSSSRVVVSILSVCLCGIVMFALAIAFRSLPSSEKQTSAEQTHPVARSAGTPQTSFGWADALGFSAAAGSIEAVVSAVVFGAVTSISGPAPAWLALLCLYLPVSNVPLTLLVTAVKSRSAAIAAGATAFSLLFLYVQSFVLMAVAGAFGLHAAAGP